MEESTMCKLLKHMAMFSGCNENYVNYMMPEMVGYIKDIKAHLIKNILLLSDVNAMVLDILLAYIVHFEHNNINLTVLDDKIIFKRHPDHKIRDLMNSMDVMRRWLEKCK